MQENSSAVAADLAEARKEIIRKDAELAAQRVELEVLRASGERIGRFPARSRKRILRRLFRPARPQKNLEEQSHVDAQGGPDPDHLEWVATSPLFNAEWYLRQYPDVAAAGVDPVRHFVEFGGLERRNPGPDFDSAYYLSVNDDVAKAEVNPLIHYLEYGQSEGRLIQPPASSGRKAVESLFNSLSAQSLRVAPDLDQASDTLPMVFETPASQIEWQRLDELEWRSERTTVTLTGRPIAFLDDQPDRELLADLSALNLLGGERKTIELRREGRREGLNPDLSPRLASTLSFRAEVSFKITDLWLQSASDLVLRAECNGQDAVVVRAFQIVKGNATLLGEHPVESDGLVLAKLAQVDQLRPIIILVCDLGGKLLASSLLPFPSLCRGGWHYGELAANAAAPSYLSDLKGYSDLIQRERRGWPDAPAFTISRIKVDLLGANGSELLLQQDMLTWLRRDVGIIVDAADTGTASPYLTETVSAGVGDTDIQLRDGGGELQLNADSVPTLAALFSRRLVHQQTGSSYVVSELGTTAPRWLVHMPPMEDLSAVQPKSVPILWPSINATAPARTTRPTSARGLPLAIQFRSERPPARATMLQPVSSATNDLLRGPAALKDDSALSVVVDCQRPCEPLLRSLATQSISDRIELLLISSAAQAPSPVAFDAFPGRCKLLPAEALPRAARLNLAASQASGSHIAVIADSLILHDGRFLETLMAIADLPRTASVGAVLVNERQFGGGTQRRFHSGGYFPSSYSFDAAPGLTITQPSTLFPFPFCTYPVLANTADLFVIRADVWREMDGFDARNLPDSRFEVDFAFRSGLKGYRNLCTSVVTATDLGNELPSGFSDLVSPAFLPHEDWYGLLNRSAVLRELRW